MYVSDELGTDQAHFDFLAHIDLARFESAPLPARGQAQPTEKSREK